MATINAEVLQEEPQGLFQGFFLGLLQSALYGDPTTCTIFSHLNLLQLPQPCAFAQAVPSLKFPQRFKILPEGLSKHSPLPQPLPGPQLPEAEPSLPNSS